MFGFGYIYYREVSVLKILSNLSETFFRYLTQEQKISETEKNAV